MSVQSLRSRIGALFGEGELVRTGYDYLEVWHEGELLRVHIQPADAPLVRAAVVFGANSNVGNVTVGDVAGGDIIRNGGTR